MSGIQLGFAATIALIALQSSAQERTDVLRFENELVEGSLSQPELTYLLKKKNFNYKKLIKIRKDFIPELKQSSEFMRDGGEQR